MKYLAGNICINADHITRADLFPSSEEESICVITLTSISQSSSEEIRLKGIEAERFWELYTKDALVVMPERDQTP